ncbi:MAG: TatD family hydrolase [Spirochaetes bacterium]|nr:TatD family hydrolase [Spirochaetota bacterium]
MRMFDTHCHLALLYQDPIEQIRVIDDAKRSGVICLANISTNLLDFNSSYRNTKNILNIYHTVGLSPSEVNNPGKDWESKLEEALSMHGVVGVGEIGLDYFHKYGDRNAQIEFFIRQLEIASNMNLPVTIHNRQAGEDMKNILRTKISHGGIMHCFSEDIEFAKEMINLGLYISFAGNLTYRNAKNLHKVAKEVPIEYLLIETDSPFLTPHGFRGKRNQPAYMSDTLNFLAELREMKVEELAEILFQNSLKVFKIKDIK